MQDRQPTDRRRPLATRGRTIHLGQFLPPSFVAAMEELASTPDAKARQSLCAFRLMKMTASIIGKHGARSTPESGRHDRRPWIPRWAKGLNRYRDSAHFEVGSQLIGQP